MSRSPSPHADADTVDCLIVGSGFGGSVAAMRLREKGYSVLVLEQGRRFHDEDFARSTGELRRYLWAPALRCFGILQISAFRDVVVLHGAGVGGGSLGYANVLQQPSDDAFATPPWQRPLRWGDELAPHYETAKRMLGVATNPRLGPADEILQEIARELAPGARVEPAPVGVHFGAPGAEGRLDEDPYFGGEGPPRRPCVHCGACMVGCRHGAKNTLVKNYLWFAERWGARIEPEREVTDIRPLGADGAPDPRDGARYEVHHRSATSLLRRHPRVTRARRVIVAAGTLGTLRLLLRCRDVTRSLPALSPRLGESVRTNGESILGVVARDRRVDYSAGIAITSILRADARTTIEPVRYPAGSDSMRWLSGPLVDAHRPLGRLARILLALVRRPGDFALTHLRRGWAERSTVLLVMQHVDTRLRMRLGRRILAPWRRALRSAPADAHRAPAAVEIGRRVTHAFARRAGGIAAGSVNESLLDIPMTAHILGGCAIGDTARDGVVDRNCQAHGYPGLYVVDGSIVPGNPGVNPSLTIAALAEWAMARMPPAGETPVTDRAGDHRPARTAPRGSPPTITDATACS